MTVPRTTRLGTRVRFVGYGVMYSNPPARGEEGTVTYMPGFKPKTYLPGPGGGLLYVNWDSIGVMGVSPNDLEKASGGRGLGALGSFKAEVIADNSGRWVGNDLRFATEKEANEYGLDLSMRWTAVRDVRTVESDEPANYSYKSGRAEHLGGLGGSSATVDRKKLAAWANDIGRQSRRGPSPHLSATSNERELLHWHAWNDPNGEWSNILRGTYEYDAPTLDELWEQLEQSYRNDQPDEGLGEDNEFPWIRLSYGDLPKKQDVIDRVGAKKYSMELTHGDADAIEECLMIVERKFAGKHDPFEEFPGKHGKHGYRFTGPGLYALIECIVENQGTVSDEERSYGPKRGEDHLEERALDLASSVLSTLNIEWI